MYFQKAFEEVLGSEGGYVNNSKDSGKETIFGISRIYNPEWLGWEIIDSIKINYNISNELEFKKFKSFVNSNQELLDLAKDQYYNEYWKDDLLNLDRIDNESIAVELFDTGINIGMPTMRKMFQEALNLINRNEKLYNDLEVDGWCGNITFEAYQKCNKQILLKVLNGLQFCHYKELAEKNPEKYEEFFNGWMRRVKF